MNTSNQAREAYETKQALDERNESRGPCGAAIPGLTNSQPGQVEAAVDDQAEDAEATALPDSAMTITFGGPPLVQFIADQLADQGSCAPYAAVVKVLGAAANLLVTLTVDMKTGGAEVSAALPAGMPGIVRVKGDNREA